VNAGGLIYDLFDLSRSQYVVKDLNIINEAAEITAISILVSDINIFT